MFAGTEDAGNQGFLSEPQLSHPAASLQAGPHVSPKIKASL